MCQLRNASTTIWIGTLSDWHIATSVSYTHLVFVKDAEDGFRYLYWNRFMEEITGIGTEEVEGHNDFELSFDAIMPAEERLGLDRDVMETGRTIEFSGKISDAYEMCIRDRFYTSYSKPMALLVRWRRMFICP